MRTIILFVVSFVIIGMLTSCTERHDREVVNQQYSAYGKTWRYTSVEHNSRGWEIFTTHGYIGQVERVQQEIFLQQKQGERIPVHDRLFALQKDGTYKKINCCDSVNTLATLHNLNGKLLVHFLQKKESATDCFVFPAGQQDNEKLQSGKQINWIDFFGEFDPVTGIFRVNSIFPGNIDWAAEMGANWKQTWAEESIDDTIKRQFLHRIPFDCSA